MATSFSILFRNVNSLTHYSYAEASNGALGIAKVSLVRKPVALL